MRGREASTFPVAVHPDFKFAFELSSDMKDFIAAEFLVDDLVPRSGLMTIYGAPSSGKSFCAIDLGAHIATGRPYLGKEVLQGGVVYVAAETGGGLRKRIAAWRRVHGVGDFPFALITTAPDLGASGGDTARLIGEIRAQQPRLALPVRLLVLDTLARVMGGRMRTRPPAWAPSSQMPTLSRRRSTALSW
jgi:hypothetical protein